jgi:hypothetical protein
MTPQDKIAFKQVMDTVTALYQKPQLDIDTLRVWFGKLEKFEFNVVTKAFDKWVDNNKFIPTVFDILQLCREKPIEFVQLQAPKLTRQQNHQYSHEVLKFMAEQQSNKPKDMRAWAKRIIANPKNYPAISLKFAQEAMAAK